MPKTRKNFHQRLSTPRPASKIILKDVITLRHQQPKQQQQDTLRSSGKPVAEQHQGICSTDIKKGVHSTTCRTHMFLGTVVSQTFFHPCGGRIFTEFYGRSAKTSDLGCSFWKIPYTFNVFMLEDKIQKRRYVPVQIFPRTQCNGSKKVEMVDSVDDLKSSCSKETLMSPIPRCSTRGLRLL